MTTSDRLKVSVVIPAHNSANRIQLPLAKLLSQTVDDDAVEIIVVDNASTDDTGKIAADYWQAHTSIDRQIDFRVIRAEKKGLIYARITGVLAARSPIVCFLDDDNVPEDNYLQVGIAEFMDESVGLIVSRIFPDYQSTITPSIEKREHLLAINEKLGDRRIEWGAIASLCPTIGAGMWLRRDVFLNTMPWRTPEDLLSGRIGNSLASGEDIEVGYFIGSAGFKRIYCPDLRLKHAIPASRLNTSYFCRLINGVVRSTLTLDLKYNHHKFGFFNKMTGIIELLVVLLAAPIVLFRVDGIREFLFVISARLAKIQGPYLQQLSTKKPMID